jgi:dihydrofolate reductase
MRRPPEGSAIGKLIVINHMTLDGVMQAPGRPDEDIRGGFERGGWAAPNTDDVMLEVLGKGMAQGGPLLLGRRTYEQFYDFWPQQRDTPFTEVLNSAQKYVASTTLSEPLPWQNSTLLKGDVGEAVAKLKEDSDEDIGVLGSGDLIQTLREHELVDEYLLMIHPLVLGTGRQLFPEGGPAGALALAESVVTTKGVVIGTYRTAE